MGSRLGSALTRKFGPLPAWAWAGVLAGALLLYRRWRGGSSGGPGGANAGTSQSASGLTSVGAPAVGDAGGGAGLADQTPLQPDAGFTSTGGGTGTPVVYDPVGGTYTLANPDGTIPINEGAPPHLQPGGSGGYAQPSPTDHTLGIPDALRRPAPARPEAPRPAGHRPVRVPGTGPTRHPRAPQHGPSKASRPGPPVRRPEVVLGGPASTTSSSRSAPTRQPARSRARTPDLASLAGSRPPGLVTPPGVRPRQTPAQAPKRTAPLVASSVAQARAISRTRGVPLVDIRVQPKSPPRNPNQAFTGAMAAGFNPTLPAPHGPAPAAPAHKPAGPVIHAAPAPPPPAPVARTRPRPAPPRGQHPGAR